MDGNEEQVRLPYGISNFVDLRKDRYAYVDKTEFIEKMESDKFVTFLRPRRFGKSLFVSTLEAYYDTRFEAQFEELFAGTYIGMHPTEERNAYSVLVFDFSNILSDDMDQLRADMFDAVAKQLTTFIKAHGLAGKVTLELEDKPKDKFPSKLLRAFFVDVEEFVSDHPIYVLIDEYDHFANSILGLRTADFISMHAKDGFLRTFYAVIKSATRSGVVNRVFVTGVSPVSLDSLTSGLGITANATCERKYHGMAGFTDQETRDLIRTVFPDKPQEARESIFNELARYYDGYRFSRGARETLFNSDTVLYYLRALAESGEPPENILDRNIASDYGKIREMFSIHVPETASMLDLGQPDGQEGHVAPTFDETMNDRIGILVDLMTEKSVEAILTEQFSLTARFDLDDFLSLLFYMGFATIESSDPSATMLKIPNHVIRSLFADCFAALVQPELLDAKESKRVRAAFRLIDRKGDISLFVEDMERSLGNFSNRTFQKFDEKYIQIVAFLKAIRYLPYIPAMEQENFGGYSDLLLLEQYHGAVTWNVLMELKYVSMAETRKAEKEEKEEKEEKDEDPITKKRNEAFSQISRYSQDPKLAELERRGRLKRFILIFSKNKCVYQEEV